MENASVENRVNFGEWYGPEILWLYLPRGTPQDADNTKPAPDELVQAARSEMERITIERAAQASLIPVADSIVLVKEIRECPHRSNTINAGCGCFLCDLGRGRAGQVTFHDCRTCVESGWPR